MCPSEYVVSNCLGLLSLLANKMCLDKQPRLDVTHQRNAESSGSHRMFLTHPGVVSCGRNSWQELLLVHLLGGLSSLVTTVQTFVQLVHLFPWLTREDFLTPDVSVQRFNKGLFCRV